jgi:hypothetical protein
MPLTRSDLEARQLQQRAIFFTLSNFDIHWIVQSLSSQGAISVPLLQEAARLELLQEAKSYCYVEQTGVVGKGDRIVKQEYSSFEAFPERSLYRSLMTEFQALMDEALLATAHYPFTIPLQFNGMVLQRYEPGQLGLTPHRDSYSAINLVCIFNIDGQGKFYQCADRKGTNSVEIDTTPGNVIFLRAPGFLESDERPFHYLTNIGSTRYSFGLRQRISRSQSTA